jgi:hypothetical protein
MDMEAEHQMTKGVVRITLEDALHYSEAQRRAIIEGYPAHELEARTKGIPSLGSGRVFPITEESIACDPPPVGRGWSIIGGMDFGWDHPFAAVKLAHDRDADCIYVLATYRCREATPIIHSAALRPWGKIPWAWPHDGLQHDKGSGKQLAVQYRDQGLELLSEFAKFEDGTYGVEAGVMAMLARMQTGRFKVARHLSEWFEEFRLYHRQDGVIEKIRDDLLSATRYAVMCLRYAETEASDAAWSDSPAWGVA